MTGGGGWLWRHCLVFNPLAYVHAMWTVMLLFFNQYRKLCGVVLNSNLMLFLFSRGINWIQGCD
uniref:Uncharacterized protein n=1 Tax=Setaria italica TaxID=4555 RepID=K3YP47_SETIT